MTRRVQPGDWYEGHVPPTASIDETAFVETSYSFLLFRGARPGALVMARASSAYLGTMFDVGPSGSVSVGEFSLLHGAWIVCDLRIDIGSHCLVSWNVVLMDTYRWPRSIAGRRSLLERVPVSLLHRGSADSAAPIRIGSNVWIGFDSIVLPGVTIGHGAVVGARSVVAHDVPDNCVVAGNPARVVKRLGLDTGVDRT